MVLEKIKRMLIKKFNISTNLTIPQIVGKLENITNGISFSGKKKVGSYYVGKYDKSGFRFIKRFPLFINIFSAKFIAAKSKTDISVSIRQSAGTTFGLIILLALMSIVLFDSGIKYNLVKVIVVSVTFLVPFILEYISFRIDLRRARLFLMDLFQISESFFNKKF